MTFFFFFVVVCRSARFFSPFDKRSPAYIVVVGESTTTQWVKSLVETEALSVSDGSPPVCVAPSTGRFEVNLTPQSMHHPRVCLSSRAHILGADLWKKTIYI